MRPLTKARALAAAGCLVVVASLGACGGDSDGGGGGSAAPDDASQDDFCEAFNGLFDTVLSQATEADSSDLVQAIKEWAADI